ncbi:MAG: peptidoglycan-N-acetylglucosamine deacetylase, partial [Bryobacterales bacterium]|nr:peptidoglycan-N-acetylglucosamine deacetylase [Bryobacterales bacterium]
MAVEQPKFVFHDPSGKRWARSRRLVQTGGLAIALLLTVLVLVAFSGTQLPSLGLPAVPPIVSTESLRGIIRGERVEKNIPYRDKKGSAKIQYVRSQSPVLHPRPAAKSLDGAPLVFGFFVNWDPGSIVSLRLHLSHITHLVPEWLVLQNANGDIDDQSDQTVIAIAQQANLPVLALLTNFRGSWQPGDVRRILNDADRRRDLITNLRSNLAEHKFAGVNVDFENMTRRDREPLVGFMKELADDLHQHGYLVTQDVPVGDDAYDIKQLAAINDYLVPMVYDEHYQSGEPGPVASETFFEDKLDELAKLAPPSKLVVGFGNYGYDWAIGGTGGREVTFDDVMAAASGSQGAIEWNATAENPVLRFTAEGLQHEVWFLDAVTALNEITAAHDNGFRGVGLWRLGAEDPGLWKVLQREVWPEDTFNPKPLETMEATQQTPRQYGTGEIIRVTQSPHGGTRTVSAPPTPDGDFAERYTKFPTPYVITHSGDLPGSKVLCLTFDDGPDPQFTPRILDILKSRHVPATFFVVGLNAENNPELIKREYADGHELGNHTYWHPNVAVASA